MLERGEKAGTLFLFCRLCKYERLNVTLHNAPNNRNQSEKLGEQKLQSRGLENRTEVVDTDVLSFSRPHDVQ